MSIVAGAAGWSPASLLTVGGLLVNVLLIGAVLWTLVENRRVIRRHALLMETSCRPYVTLGVPTIADFGGHWEVSIPVQNAGSVPARWRATTGIYKDRLLTLSAEEACLFQGAQSAVTLQIPRGAGAAGPLTVEVEYAPIGQEGATYVRRRTTEMALAEKRAGRIVEDVAT